MSQRGKHRTERRYRVLIMTGLILVAAAAAAFALIDVAMG